MRPSEKKALAMALGIGYGISVPAFADLVVLRNGEKLEGSVTGQTISNVNFVGDDGRVQLISKSTIASIFYFSRRETDKQEIKLVALKKEEAKEEREEKLKKKREEDRKRRDKELREKREEEQREAELADREDLVEEVARQAENEIAEKEPGNEIEAARQQERRRLEALRLEKTRGTVRLWSGQEIKAQIVEKHGQHYVLETSAGFMEFHTSEIEQMKIPASSDGSRPERIIDSSNLEAVKKRINAEDSLDLSSGMNLAYETTEFDGYNTQLESEFGRIQLRPDDSRSSRTPAEGMDLTVGQHGYVMLRSGLKVSGDLILRSRYEWVLQTEKGEVHFNADDIVFARAEARTDDSFTDNLIFWR